MTTYVKTAKELREALAGVPDETVVIMARDEEGNGFSPIDEITTGHYEPETSWSGEWWDDATPEDVAQYGLELAVFLWPVN